MSQRRVVPVHATVPGRTRLHVEGLRHSDALRAVLEARLAAEPAIQSAQANTWTGNVLVRHSSQLGREWLTRRIEQLIDADIQQTVSTAGMPPEVASDRPATPCWHVLDAKKVVDALGTSGTGGLGGKDAARRLKRHGPNALAMPEGRSHFGILAEQFTSLPVALLGAAAVVSLTTGGVLDAVAILGVVALNGAIGFVTESQAERTIAALRTLGHPTARIVRERRHLEIPADQVVPGDLLALVPGGFVAADGRIVAARELTIDESVLTGESLAVLKRADRLEREDLPLGDRLNMVYRGTVVAGGEGMAVAVATGAATEIGRIQALVGTAQRPETPMERQLERVGTQLVWICTAVCGLVFGLGLVRGYGLLPMLRTSVSLAVAAVPEGLPALATSTLALGIGAMRRQNVQIRQLGAVETLGSVQVLCFDKTGTLTRNEMSVVEVSAGRSTFEMENGQVRRGEQAITPSAHPDLARLLEIGALCNETAIDEETDGYSLNGSPTESALVRAALEGGIDVPGLRRQRPLVGMRHRTEARQFVSTVHEGNGRRRLVAVKGNPLAVLEMCGHALRDGEQIPLDEHERERIARENGRMAGKALRVLGFACADADEEEEALDGGLTWLGLAGLADPVRSGMRELMRTFHRAGTRTVMITGDQSATAHAIARQLDLSQGRDVEILDSAHLERLDPEMLKALAQRAHVFARVSPAHKLQIVQALQGAGRVVAMTGDGVNDSPALKAADIGIAMGRTGTDLAREVADVVLADDDLRTMAAAIGQGRTIYSNIRKAVHYLLATNLTEILVTLAATAAGRGQPLSPIQLLWINLVSDILPALGLALEPPEPDVLARPPRDPAEPILRRGDFRRIGQEAALISAGALAAYGYAAARYGGSGPRTSTITLASLITSQLLHALTSRSDTHGFFTREQLPPNRWLQAGLGLAFAAQLGALFMPPLRNLLGIAPLNAADAMVALATGTLPFLANEAVKIGRQPPLKPPGTSGDER